ncbi:unnamed protein product, partial [Allacma fusca]
TAFIGSGAMDDRRPSLLGAEDVYKVTTNLTFLQEPNGIITHTKDDEEDQNVKCFDEIESQPKNNKQFRRQKPRKTWGCLMATVIILSDFLMKNTRDKGSNRYFWIFIDSGTMASRTHLLKGPADVHEVTANATLLLGSNMNVTRTKYEEADPNVRFLDDFENQINNEQIKRQKSRLLSVGASFVNRVKFLILNTPVLKWKFLIEGKICRQKRCLKTSGYSGNEKRTISGFATNEMFEV